MTEAVYTATQEYKRTADQSKRKHRVSVSGILKKLGVSHSGYQAWKKRGISKSKKRKARMKEKIQTIYEKSHKNYGAPKIAEELRKGGETIQTKTVGNYMREMGIQARWVKKSIRTTIHPDFSEALQNILQEQFNPPKPNAVWVSDITYIWTQEGFVYLTSIMDLFSRKIISWELSRTLEAVHVVKAVEKAKALRNIDKPLVFHADRGSQFVCQAFLDATKEMINSYSKKAYPWDNACIESFHALIKREWIYFYKILDYQHAYRLVFEYIETFYNTVRIHSHCGYLSPDHFEREYFRKDAENIKGKAS